MDFYVPNRATVGQPLSHVLAKVLALDPSLEEDAALYSVVRNGIRPVHALDFGSPVAGFCTLVGSDLLERVVSMSAPLRAHHPTLCLEE